MRAIPETIAPELGEDGRGGPGWSDERDPGDLRKGRFGSEELHVRAGGEVSVVVVGGSPHH